MTNTQTFHCIAKVAHDKMPERYRLKTSKRDEYEHVFCVVLSVPSSSQIEWRVPYFTDGRETGYEEYYAILLPGILRDIAGAMGAYVFALPFYNEKEYIWYARYSRLNKSNIINCVFLIPDENKTEGIPMLYESSLSAELAAVWQIMHDVFGSDYCAAIEREVCSG